MSNATKKLGFLSTPSARRATRDAHGCHFFLGISIHALREEGDHQRYSFPVVLSLFLSTPSARRATVKEDVDHAFHRFLSTPSARRATGVVVCTAASVENFYPRPPRGGRHTGVKYEYTNSKFLSTPSARRATALPCSIGWVDLISIHALREEGDRVG